MVRNRPSGLILPARQVMDRFLSRRSFVNQVRQVNQARRIRTDCIPRLSSNVSVTTHRTPGHNRLGKQHEDALETLVEAGFVRKTQAGLFHLLPLGLRVQEKIEKLIDRHMQQIGASKLALSTLSTEALWEQTGRLPSVGSELFRLVDRKGTPFLLAPTHEEEITSLVAQTLRTYHDLPLRLYQITRKYRDELRPRHGLLRGREFVMKDLYTFDYSFEAALATYSQVRAAYKNFFAELKLPVIVAMASSGDMGGDMSHEYLLPTALGEDNVVTCSSCDYAINDELAETRLPEVSSSTGPARVWRGITADKTTLVNIWYPETTAAEEGDSAVNIYAAKSLVPGLDASIENVLSHWAEFIKSKEGLLSDLRVLNLVDGRLPKSIVEEIESGERQQEVWPAVLGQMPPTLSNQIVDQQKDGSPLNFLRIQSGDPCPKCHEGTLKVQKAIELGHTFHLGTRYSEPLRLKVDVPKDRGSGAVESVHVQMGCHGIGISRIFGVIANLLADSEGLSWPRNIAPYEVVIVERTNQAMPTHELYRLLSAYFKSRDVELDAVIDDRKWLGVGKRLVEANLVGYPVVVVMGGKNSQVEVQSRAGVTEQVDAADLPGYLLWLLDRL